jgi:hypothetical protein
VYAESTSKSLKTDLFGACYEEHMKANSQTYDENKQGNVKRVNLVNIHNIKQWARANLPVKSQLRGIMLLEEDVLGAEEFLAKMDLWLKLFERDWNNHQIHTVIIDSS